MQIVILIYAKLLVQVLKHSFFSNPLSWGSTYIEVGSISLIGVVDWVGFWWGRGWLFFGLSSPFLYNLFYCILVLFFYKIYPFTYQKFSIIKKLYSWIFASYLIKIYPCCLSWFMGRLLNTPLNLFLECM